MTTTDKVRAAVAAEYRDEFAAVRVAVMGDTDTLLCALQLHTGRAELVRRASRARSQLAAALVELEVVAGLISEGRP